MKSSKKRQVRRAALRKAFASASARGRWPALGGDLLAHQAITGEKAHSVTKGAARGWLPERANRIKANAAAAKAKLPANRMRTLRRSSLASRLTCAAVIHSRRRRRRKSRTIVRMTASGITHA